MFREIFYQWQNLPENLSIAFFYFLHRGQWSGTLWSSFLDGLSLHLNHLIASRAANYDWPFGTLPFGLFIWSQNTMWVREWVQDWISGVQGLGDIDFLCM